MKFEDYLVLTLTLSGMLISCPGEFERDHAISDGWRKVLVLLGLMMMIDCCHG